MTIVVDDPKLRTAWPVIPGVRYFHADDGGVTYTVVANDLDHAKQILRDSGTEFCKDDGNTCSFDEAMHIEWVEWTVEKAATVHMHDEDRGGQHALNTHTPGDWFCSEF